MDLASLIAAWPYLDGAHTEPLTRGTNNLMYRVDAASGAFVLRLAGADVAERRLRFEADVLTQLSALGLPFALPAPLMTVHGDPFARVSDGDGEHLATLTPLIVGAEPQRDDLAQASGAGDALALLDAALARIEPADPDAAIGWRLMGDLARCHPAVPDPRAALATLLLSPSTIARLIEGYDTLAARIPALWTSLPLQLCHEDYDTSNVLMQGAHVTGVLDFEFCGRDVRAMDLVVAMVWWPEGRMGTGREWPIFTALLGGYARSGALSSAEVAAIPALMRFRSYTSLIHRLGRQRSGLSPMEHVLWRAEAALQRDDWLREHSERLIQLVDEALR